MKHRFTLLSETAYHGMVCMYALHDLLMPRHAEVLDSFGIRPGFTVVDYGCGPGRYLAKASELVGPAGLVWAADVSRVGLRYASRRAERLGLANVRLARVENDRSEIPDGVADLVYALDMFHAVEDPVTFLAEIHRFTRPTGCLILEDGHQSRGETRDKVGASGLWGIQSETRGHLRCVPFGPR